jgi:hypothetical protein
VITGASNTPIFSTRCINFQSLACINLYPLLTYIAIGRQPHESTPLRLYRDSVFVQGGHDGDSPCGREIGSKIAMDSRSVNRRGVQKMAVALAAKMVRTAWALMAREESYRMAV